MAITTALTLSDAVREYEANKAPQLTEKSLRGYQAILADLLGAFPETAAGALQGPAGRVQIEAWLESRWAHLAPRTYNKTVSVLKDFFAWATAQGVIEDDPARDIPRKKFSRAPREAFTESEREAILRSNPDPRDSVPLRLLIDQGITKGELQTARFGDFDQQRGSASVVGRRGATRRLVIDDEEFWTEFNRLRVLTAGDDSHYVLPRVLTRRHRPRRGKELDALVSQVETIYRTASELAEHVTSSEATVVVEKLKESAQFARLWRARAFSQATAFPDEPRGEHGIHDWWYRCLIRAGLAEAGKTRGQRIQKARHTVGRRLVDKTGSLKAVQAQLGIGSGGATGDVYTNRDADELDTTMRSILRQMKSGGEHGEDSD